METKLLDKNNESSRRCSLCERVVRSVSRHHLVPKEKGGTFGEIVPLCQPCHSTIHYTFSNKELAKEYNTIPKLQQSERLQKYLDWIRNKPIEKISNRRKR